MRKISNFNNKKLHALQFNFLVEVFSKITRKDEMFLFLVSFLSESERAYLGQRLHIVKLLIARYTYGEIEEKLRVSSTTIINAKKCLDAGGEKIIEPLLKCFLDYEESLVKEIKEKNENFKLPHFPGSL